MFLCDPGVPLFLCFSNSNGDNEFKIPVNKLMAVSHEAEIFRKTSTPVFIQAVSKPGTGFSGTFKPSCMFHATPLFHNGVSQVACEENCFLESNVGTPRLAGNCLNGTTIPSEQSRDRARAGMNRAAAALGLTNFNAFATGVVPSSLFQSASTDMCTGDVIAEFSVSLLQISASKAIDVTILSQPRYDVADRCSSTKAVAQRLCFDTTPYVNSLFSGALIGDGNGFVCVEEFLVSTSDNVSGSEIRPNNFRASDAVLKILVGDILDASFSIATRSSGCPSTIPAALCAASSLRLCHINECL